jgi:hypothetical protein
MTYGRGRFVDRIENRIGADVSHSAELVRGDFANEVKAPSSAPSGHLLPKGRRARVRR